MIVAIVSAEVAFWLLLLGGLALRYLVRARRASTAVLAAVPLVDLALVAFVGIDVARGAAPTQAHGLAAVYLGVTVAFGHSVVVRTDAHVRHRFAGGPRPSRPAKGSQAEVRALWREWARVVLAAAVAAAGLLAMIAVEGRAAPAGLDEAVQHPYWATAMLLGLVTAGWFLAGPAFAGRGRPDHPAPVGPDPTPLAGGPREQHPPTGDR